MVTTERFHATGSRDFVILAQGGEAADKLLQIFQGKIFGNSVSVLSTRVHPERILASLKRLHSNPQKVCNNLHTRQFRPLGIDVGITLRVPNIAIPDTDYEDGPAQGLDKLDPQGISTWITRKKTPIRILLGLL